MKRIESQNKEHTVKKSLWTFSLPTFSLKFDFEIQSSYIKGFYLSLSVLPAANSRTQYSYYRTHYKSCSWSWFGSEWTFSRALCVRHFFHLCCSYVPSPALPPSLAVTCPMIIRDKCSDSPFFGSPPITGTRFAFL